MWVKLTLQLPPTVYIDLNLPLLWYYGSSQRLQTYWLSVFN